MSVLNFMANLPRYGLRVYEWATGRRLYPWTTSPPHRLFSMLAHRAYGWPAPHYRALYAAAAGVLKYRERLFADRINFSARLRGPVNADVLRNTILWQHAVLALPPTAAKSTANLHVSGDVEQVQIDRVISLLMMSDVFGSVNVFFDEQAALDARVVTLTVAEERRGREDQWDLNAPRQIHAGIFDGPGWARIFSPRTGFDRNINNYLKVAHPESFIIALELPENEDGFCDEWIGSWEEALCAFAREFPDVALVVLNRTGPGVFQGTAGSARGAISFARKAGLTLPEAVILAQKADAFVGQMGMFGLAARATRRPGVYMSPEGVDLSDPQAGVIHTGLLAPNETMARLRTILADRKTPAAFASAALSDSGLGKRPDQASGAPHPTNNLHAAQDTGRQFTPQAGGAPCPDDPLATQYTLVVPTYNRHDMLARLLAFLGRHGASFSVLVLDSSEAGIQQENARAISGASANVRHVAFPSTMDPYVKMREGLGMVTTRFCSLCADDDLILLPAVRRGVEELDRDPALAVAHGHYFNFTETSTFDLSYIVYRGNSLDGKTPLARVRTLFAGYEAVFYGIYRTSIAQRVFRDVDRIDTVLGRELLMAALTVIAGKTLRIPDFYYGRSTGESFSYTAWHPHQILAQTPAALFTQYPLFRELLLEALAEQPSAPDPQTAGKVIDLIMLRYLDPFLRNDVLDLIIDDRLRGKNSNAVVDHLWDVFVRSRRSTHPVEPLTDAAGQFMPDRFGPGRPRDYSFDSTAMDGRKREYRVFYEFIYPDMRPPAAVRMEQLMLLLGSLDAY